MTRPEHGKPVRTTEQRQLDKRLLSAKDSGHVRRLLARGADPDARDRDGEPVLFAHLDPINLAITQALLEGGANPKTEYLRRSPIHHVISGGMTNHPPTQVIADAIRLLIRHGADASATSTIRAVSENTVSNDRITPMHLLNQRTAELGKILHDGGADLAVKTNGNISAWQSWLMAATDTVWHTQAFGLIFATINPNTPVNPIARRRTGDLSNMEIPAWADARDAEQALLFAMHPETHIEEQWLRFISEREILQIYQKALTVQFKTSIQEQENKINPKQRDTAAIPGTAADMPDRDGNNELGQPEKNGKPGAPNSRVRT